MTGRPPFLPIYSHEARYTKAVPFVKNSLYKGKGLDLDRGEASPNKALLSSLPTPSRPPYSP